MPVKKLGVDNTPARMLGFSVISDGKSVRERNIESRAFRFFGDAPAEQKQVDIAAAVGWQQSAARYPDRADTRHGLYN